MDSRICNVCKIDKSLDYFHNAKRLPLGKCYTCKPCAKLRSVSWNSNNPDKKKISGRLHYEKDKESYVERAKKLGWAKLNKEKVREAAKIRWYKSGSEGPYKLARRRAIKKSASPDWLTNSQKEDIKNFYWLAKDLKAVTGEDYQVDHIVPLQNDIICGLHVPWNLQVLPREVNIRKNNKFDPSQAVFGY